MQVQQVQPSLCRFERMHENPGKPGVTEVCNMQRNQFISVEYKVYTFV